MGDIDISREAVSKEIAALQKCEADPRCYYQFEETRALLGALRAALDAAEARAVATLVEAVERLNAACDAMWNDHERLEKNTGYFAGQQPWQLKEAHMKAISEAQQALPSALAPFARKRE